MEMPGFSRRRALVYVLVLLTALALAGSYAFGRDGPEATPLQAPALSAEPPPVRELVVHVVGAVREPGLYKLREGSRVDDAIERAGGAKPRAALELVNLASPVADGQQVVVPMRDSENAMPSVPTGGAGAAGAAGGVVHLNSATLEDLDTLPGIGPITAQKILDYRTANGAFSSVDELWTQCHERRSVLCPEADSGPERFCSVDSLIVGRRTSRGG